MTRKPENQKTRKIWFGLSRLLGRSGHPAIRPSERGAVALITTIITAVVMSIITTGLTRGLTGEFRQTIDIASSERAFYAAEAGVEDALQRIKDHSNDPADPYYYTETDGRADRTGAIVNSPIFRHTGPGNDLGSNQQADDPGAKWIHRYVKVTTQASEGLLKKDRSVQIDFGRRGVARIVIEWDSPDRGDTNKRPPWVTDFPPDWAARGEPAALEATLVSWSEAGGSEVTSFDPVRKYLGRACQSSPPTCGGPEIGTMTFDPNREYHLRWEIAVPALDLDKIYILRLRDWFVDTHYRVTAYDVFGDVLEIPDQYITIDVTGKAGETYRRLVVKKKFQADIFSIFDFVLASEEDLCKSFTVYADFTPDVTFCP